ncbi:SRPBCC family protein [Kitasatospora sp. NPDC001175]|uniref:SRPBCC family protein n=1 Tax=Kitasatospora sp. NPDC001175 TaxID=3157103 RepID=UPI003CFF416D
MPRTQQEPPPSLPNIDRLGEEVVNYLGAQLEHLVDKAGDKIADVTDHLTDIAANGGVLPKVGLRVLQGDSPVKAFLGEKAKSIKDSVIDKVKETFGRGKAGRKAGKKVMNIVEALDIGVPVRAAYNHWTQYEDFSGFTKGVRSVSPVDEVSTNWKVKVGPSTRGWKATVQEQVPDERIVWTSEGAKGTTRGAVSFHELTPTLTRVVLVVEYYPSGFFEKTGNIWRAQGRRLRLDFKNFQRHVSLATDEAEGWRGEIRDGEVVRTHEEAMEEEAWDSRPTGEYDEEEPEDEYGDEEESGEDRYDEEEPEDEYGDEEESGEDRYDEEEPEDEYGDGEESGEDESGEDEEDRVG